MAKLLHELTELLEMKLKHDSLKHPQTIGVVERSHSALKRILKLNTDEKWTTWYKYTDLATFIHNTSYHSILKNRYPERSNRRIPGPSNDVHSASFQLNMFSWYCHTVYKIVPSTERRPCNAFQSTAWIAHCTFLQATQHLDLQFGDES